MVKKKLWRITINAGVFECERLMIWVFLGDDVICVQICVWDNFDYNTQTFSPGFVCNGHIYYHILLFFFAFLFYLEAACNFVESWKKMERRFRKVHSVSCPKPSSSSNSYHPAKDACWLKGQPVPFRALAQMMYLVEVGFEKWLNKSNKTAICALNVS